MCAKKKLVYRIGDAMLNVDNRLLQRKTICLDPREEGKEDKQNFEERIC